MTTQPRETNYDAIIIGAGLSGLACGIRLSHFGKKVLILESHYVPGGLNSYYAREGMSFDVGLHAMTNYAPAGARNTPLTKLLRQLRIRHEDLQLAEQLRSQVIFPGRVLQFDNDPATLRAEVARLFPDQLAGFDALNAELAAFDETSLEAMPDSARAHLRAHISSPALTDMLFCPIMYYGNPAEDDMDWAHFAVMWKSIFGQGFCRPAIGMQKLIELLVTKFIDNGGELRLRTPAERLEIEGGAVSGVQVPGGEILYAPQVFSSAGWVETMRLCGDELRQEAGQISYAELILVLDAAPADLGMSESITFFNCEDAFEFRASPGLIDDNSGVICCPDNFRYNQPPAQHMVRVTMKAGFAAWEKLAPHEYKAAKEQTKQIMIGAAAQFMPELAQHITFSDLFTPLTIKRFTGHDNGAVYGAPHKRRPALTPYQNLYLIGSDQGFLGIVGALLSGITIANLHGLGAAAQS